MTVYMLLANGFEETEALVPLDLLRRADIDVKIVGVGDMSITGAHGIKVECDLPAELLIGETDAPSCVILPGGMPGALNLDAWAGMDDLLARTYKAGGRLAAICAAPLILGRRGYLNGKKAVCYPGYEKELKGAVVTDDRVVTDGMITTGVGMGAAYEFGLMLVSLLASREQAKKLVASTMGDPRLLSVLK